ncbi:hypothetical protein C8F04DRAFT_1270889 [Mycena alexandri]|uniref:Uncharacterized protein n=1 Tax=Mycena alexandri TaxID=1745969 RepID=A0AAD6WSP4_9AGAR|nr:hypothetical protein C8F04DRAFT_1270889 [Mycena alexandri]
MDCCQSSLEVLVIASRRLPLYGLAPVPLWFPAVTPVTPFAPAHCLRSFYLSTVSVHTGTALNDYPTNTGYALVSPVQAIPVPSPSSSSYNSDLGIGHFPISQPEANIRSSPRYNTWQNSADASWCADFDEHPQRMVDQYSDAYFGLNVLREPVQRPYIPTPAPEIPETAFDNSHTSEEIKEVYRAHAGVRELHDKAEVKRCAEWKAKCQAELEEYEGKQAQYRANIPLVWKDRHRQIMEYNAARRNADNNILWLLNSIGEYAYYFLNSVVPARSAVRRSVAHPASGPLQGRAASAPTAASKVASSVAPVASSSRSRSSFVNDQIADESSGGAFLEQGGGEGLGDDDGEGESEREASEALVPSARNKGKGRKVGSPEVVAERGVKGESGVAANTYDEARWHRENDLFSGPMPESQRGKAISTHGWTPTKTALSMKLVKGLEGYCVEFASLPYRVIFTRGKVVKRCTRVQP